MKSDNIFVKAISSVSHYLTKEQKKKMGLFILALLMTSVLDVVGLAAIIPVIQIATDHSMIETNYYISMVYNFLGFESVSSFLLFLIIGVFSLFLFKNVVVILVDYRRVKFIASVTVSIADNQFSKYYGLKFWQFKNLGASKVINYVNATPQKYCYAFLSSLFKIMAEFFVISLIILGIAIYQPVLFFILTIVLGPTAILIYQGLKNKTKKIGEEMDELRPEAFSSIYDSFAGYVDVKLADKQKYFQEHFLKVKKDFLDLKALSRVYKKLPPKAVETIAILGVVLIFIYSLYFSSQTANVLTLLGLFVAAAYRLMPSITRILSSFMTLKKTQYALDNLEIYREKKYQEEVSTKTKPITFKNDIKISDLDYSFPDAKLRTLKNISFRVKKGERVGIIGSSGSGKTTLMNILLGFYKPGKGLIRIDGEPLAKQNILSWRKMIGYVRQDVFIMKGTLKENITLAEEDVNIEQLNKAVEQASLKEFVDGLSDGMNTYVGEGGSRLSGGQKQRVGIARALYHKAEILFFDEATSALDNKTEREVTQAINNLSDTDVTLFIIAHRVTTLKECDRIYELKNGEISGIHQYQEVIADVI